MRRQALWLLLLAGLAGCLGGSRPAPLVRQYILEYPPPAVAQIEGVAASLKVERFSAVRLYAGPEMIARRGPYQREDYYEQRWRVAPPDMVTDALRRDLRQAGLFKSVLTARDREETRFVLEGGVEEFLETGQGEARKASLAVTITLLDMSRRGIGERLLFQKTYRSEAACIQGGGRRACRGYEPGHGSVLGRAHRRYRGGRGKGPVKRQTNAGGVPSRRITAVEGRRTATAGSDH